jgi:hypothetical protein
MKKQCNQLEFNFKESKKMATKKKTAPKKKRVTSATVKAELKAKGYKLPHGYEVVKRKPKTTKRKTTKKAKK